MTTNPATRGGAVAFFVGVFLVLEGVWGIFSPIVFWVLTINHTRALIHLVLGLGAIRASRRYPADYLYLLGTLITAVGVLWAIPGTHNFILQFLEVNKAAALLDAFIGPLCLLTAFLARRQNAADWEHSDTRSPL